ncbi:MAG: 1-acyl-sn-glycerol-3-phosphate acyltransferase [Paucibacter sp.]|nr:1-acyl-sn-glycerol-3-phosphate acyltransferase [Roseateles sp.]
MQTPHLITGPRPIQLKGSAVARFLMGLFGWRVEFEGLPALQGVVMVYPHTSNWDFPVGIFAKWAIGIPVKFWGKDSLFKPPVIGRWMRWIGGVPIDRTCSKGMVGGTVAQIDAARDAGEFFWLAVAPEGTRSLTTGWRSGAYRVALEAKVPVALAALDFGTKTVRFTQFVELSGDAQADFALFAQILAGARAKRPEQAGPIALRP